jgi:hypothetical protein
MTLAVIICCLNTIKALVKVLNEESLGTKRSNGRDSGNLMSSH